MFLQHEKKLNPGAKGFDDIKNLKTSEQAKSDMNHQLN